MESVLRIFVILFCRSEAMSKTEDVCSQTQEGKEVGRRGGAGPRPASGLNRRSLRVRECAYHTIPVTHPPGKPLDPN